ncbi:hypothetical protein BGC07_16155 [Piscirickettsia litoralis]|uniref:Uncharacterized protein n=1 Tax=Piscirickettsia litoralis TaxID=1891921 RepID=A0ABX2ZZH2_9GAMM|nr:hypothetical protein BGC07_16155 [Piscirickettsia litoralis]
MKKHSISLIKGDYRWEEKNINSKDISLINSSRRSSGYSELDMENQRQFIRSSQQLQKEMGKRFRKSPISHVNLVGWSRGGDNCTYDCK